LQAAVKLSWRSAPIYIAGIPIKIGIPAAILIDAIQRQCGRIARVSTHSCRRQGGRWQLSRKSQPAQL
jgi:hypothetical protein